MQKLFIFFFCKNGSVFALNTIYLKFNVMLLLNTWALAADTNFFDYKTEFFSFQNNPKDLDPSCKMDLDLWGCLGRVKMLL